MSAVLVVLLLVAAFAAYVYLSSKTTGKGAILGRNKVFSL